MWQRVSCGVRGSTALLTYEVARCGRFGDRWDYGSWIAESQGRLGLRRSVEMEINLSVSTRLQPPRYG